MKVLLLGSGGLCIGQAGEFDYSGSQAIKALKEEGISTILVNPNVATVQTDEGLADRVYLQPLRCDMVTQIIEKERPDGILLGFGGQTALNLGLALNDTGVLEKFGVKVLGTPVETIRITEDRLLFKKVLEEIKVTTPHSFAATTVSDALDAARQIGFPLMMRSGFSLGGLGSRRIASEEELRKGAAEALNNAPQILIEEYLEGYKEIEYEMVRDAADNAIAVCNMENFDPMGIHTGESIVVAPSQTLTNQEYYKLREVALKTVRHLGVVGECNIQYALHPSSGEYRVIEVNARLSRSSALASKATGYPLAFVAAKVALGKRLDEITNSITQKTSAFFEPALDYIVVKMPRWDLQKFESALRTIGSEMKSVGEVMAIGRSFPEALQKAVRSLGRGIAGIGDYPEVIEKPDTEIRACHATDRRLFAIYMFLERGGTVEEVHQLSGIDRWFLCHLQSMVDNASALASHPLDAPLLLESKKNGFSDATIARLQQRTEADVRAARTALGLKPFVKQIDTLAGEFAAVTNYLYTTYHGSTHDIEPSPQKAIVVLGSGPYCIGSSVEFDWCAVNALKSLRALGKNTIMVNSNPETVSTDYDQSDRLYFEELTFERIADILDFEDPEGVMLSMGGQLANNLATQLDAHYPILGTSARSIDMAESRHQFSTLLMQLGIDQPKWCEVTHTHEALRFAKDVGYPILVRPSYVLSGSAMSVIYDALGLEKYIARALAFSKGQSVVVSQFILGAKELEIDGVARTGKIISSTLVEHVENAGVHSGDATIVLPPQKVYVETVRLIKKITQSIVSALEMTGPFNIQFLAKNHHVQVIECNARASRSFPFVSKVTNHNLVAVAVKAMLGIEQKLSVNTLELNHVGVKAPVFSYNRLKGANPVAHVEMASTGEVACLGNTFEEALLRAWFACGHKIDGKRILFTVSRDKRPKLLESIARLDTLGWELFTTEGTHDFLAKHGIASRVVFKASNEPAFDPHITSIITQKQVDLIINIPTRDVPSTVTDGFTIRRLAIDHSIPLITNLEVAQALLNCITTVDVSQLPIQSWNEYAHHVS